VINMWSLKKLRIFAGASVFLLLAVMPVLAVVEFDTFYAIDVSGSMAGIGSNNVAIIKDVKARVVADIESRRIGDFVHISVFGGPPRMLAERTIQSKVDKDALIEAVNALSPSDPATLLYASIIDIYGKASLWARQYTNHTVDIRIYSDGANNGPPRPSLADVTNKVSGLREGEIPNLYGYLMVYFQKGDTASAELKNAVEEMRSNGFGIGSPSDVFLRLTAGGTDFGNARAWPKGKTCRLLTFYESDLRNQAFYCEPVVVESSGAKAELNIKPRPLQVSDDVIHPTLQVVNLGDIPDMDVVKLRGKIQFSGKSSDPNKTLRFHPPSVPFTARIAPLREIRLQVAGLCNAFHTNGAGWGGITAKDFVYSDRGLATKWLKIRVMERVRSLPEDKVKLEVRPCEPRLAGYPIVRFVGSSGDRSEGSSEAEIDGTTSNVFVRVEYRSEHIKGLVAASQAIEEIVVTASDEDLAVMVALEGAESPALVSVTKIGILPCLPKAKVEIDSKTGEMKFPGKGIVPPPSDGKRWTVSLLSLVLVLFVLRYLGLPMLWGSLLALVFGLTAGFFRYWVGWFVIPMKYGVVWYWLVAVIYILASPPPFVSLLGRFLRGGVIFRVSGGRTYNLAEVSLRKGSADWSGMQYFDRNTVSEKELDPSVDEGRYTLSCSRLPLLSLFISPVVRLHVYSSGVERQSAGGWQEVQPGQSVVLKSRDAFRVSGVEHKIQAGYFVA